MKWPDDYINKVICGDCLEVMKGIPDKSVDLVLTSPPYNKTGYRGHRDNSKGRGRWSGADIAYGNFQDDLAEPEYQKWQIQILNECYRTLKKRGSVLYNHKIRRAKSQASHPMEWLLKTNLKFYQQIIWDRGSTPDHNLTYLDPITELIFWFTKDKPLCHKDNKWATEIWRFNADNNNNHPAPFPLTLANLCISLTTLPDMLILDPFLGSGTTAVACKELGRKYIGIEINEHYCQIAERRLAQDYLF